MTVVVEPDREAVCAALRRESRRVAGLVGGCTRLDAAVPGLDWTAGQVATHLSVVYRAFASVIRGEPFGSMLNGIRGTVQEMTAAANARALEASTAVGPAEIAGDLEAGADELLGAVAGCPDLGVGRPAPWYGPEAEATTGTLAALGVSETLVHGHDLARAVGGDRRLPAGSAAAVAATVMSGMLPRLLDPVRAGSLAAGFELRVRGGQRFVLRVGDGKAWAEAAGGQRVDCVISMSAVAALLTGMNRQPMWRAIATGGMVAFGRRPWLAPRLHTLFPPP
jgi:uncharacterized protein (TIGR03083 family)